MRYLTGTTASQLYFKKMEQANMNSIPTALFRQGTGDTDGDDLHFLRVNHYAASILLNLFLLKQLLVIILHKAHLPYNNNQASSFV